MGLLRKPPDILKEIWQNEAQRLGLRPNATVEEIIEKQAQSTSAAKKELYKGLKETFGHRVAACQQFMDNLDPKFYPHAYDKPENQQARDAFALYLNELFNIYNLIRSSDQVEPESAVKFALIIVEQNLVKVHDYTGPQNHINNTGYPYLHPMQPDQEKRNQVVFEFLSRYRNP